MLKGKTLESNFKKFCNKKGIYHIRFYDSMSARGFLPPTPADFLVLLPRPVFIECKETNEQSIPFANFRPSQLKAMRDMFNLGIEYYVAVLYKRKQYLLLDSRDILSAINAGKKSINISKNNKSLKIEEIFKGVLYK
jgi:hypothetical protein